MLGASMSVRMTLDSGYTVEKLTLTSARTKHASWRMFIMVVLMVANQELYVV